VLSGDDKFDPGITQHFARIIIDMLIGRDCIHLFQGAHDDALSGGEFGTVRHND
jgi:hypothetical protein